MVEMRQKPLHSIDSQLRNDMEDLISAAIQLDFPLFAKLISSVTVNLPASMSTISAALDVTRHSICVNEIVNVVMVNVFLPVQRNTILAENVTTAELHHLLGFA